MTSVSQCFLSFAGERILIRQNGSAFAHSNKFAISLRVRLSSSRMSRMSLTQATQLGAAWLGCIFRIFSNSQPASSRSSALTSLLELSCTRSLFRSNDLEVVCNGCTTGGATAALGGGATAALGGGAGQAGKYAFDFQILPLMRLFVIVIQPASTAIFKLSMIVCRDNPVSRSSVLNDRIKPSPRSV